MRWYEQTEERLQPGVVYTHKNLIEILKVKAEEDDRSLSQYINRVLRKMLMDKEEKN